MLPQGLEATSKRQQAPGDTGCSGMCVAAAVVLTVWHMQWQGTRHLEWRKSALISLHPVTGKAVDQLTEGNNCGRLACTVVSCCKLQITEGELLCC